MPTLRKYLTEEELDRLLSVIKLPRDRALFTVAYWRGLRASEVKMVMVSDWNDSESRIYIHRLKRSDDGEYPLSPVEVKTLRRWMRVRGMRPGPIFITRLGTGIGRKSLHALMRYYGGLAGIPLHLRHFHALKHSICTHLVGKQVPMHAIQDWAGHKSIKSTEVYAKFRNADRDRAAEMVYSGRKKR